MKTSFGTILVQVTLLIFVGLKSLGQLLSVFDRLGTPGGVATLIGSSLYIIAIVGILLKKRWAVILLPIVLFVEIVSTMINPSIDFGERVIASLIDTVFISLSYFLYKKFGSLQIIP